MKVELDRSLTDVVFDCAGGYFHDHTNLGVTEALGQQIQNLGFSPRHVNRKRPPSRWHGVNPQELLGGSC